MQHYSFEIEWGELAVWLFLAADDTEPVQSLSRSERVKVFPGGYTAKYLDLES